MGYVHVNPFLAVIPKIKISILTLLQEITKVELLNYQTLSAGCTKERRSTYSEAQNRQKHVWYSYRKHRDLAKLLLLQLNAPWMHLFSLARCCRDGGGN